MVAMTNKQRKQEARLVRLAAPPNGNTDDGPTNHLELPPPSGTVNNGVVDGVPPAVDPPVEPPPVHVETLVELARRRLAEHNAKTALLEAEILFAGINDAGAAILNGNSGFMEMSKLLLTNVRFEMYYNVTSKLWTAGRETIVNHVSGAKPVPGVRAARGDTTMVVNGISYPTAAAAIHALCVETVGKPMSRPQIEIYLRARRHTVLDRA